MSELRIRDNNSEPFLRRFVRVESSKPIVKPAELLRQTFAKEVDFSTEAISPETHSQDRLHLRRPESGSRRRLTPFMGRSERPGKPRRARGETRPVNEDKRVSPGGPRRLAILGGYLEA